MVATETGDTLGLFTAGSLSGFIWGRLPREARWSQHYHLYSWPWLGAHTPLCVSHPESWGGGHYHILQVGAEESMWEILHRYLPYNAHAASYTWKYEGKKLNMDFTLEENGIRDEGEEFDSLNMDGALYTPAILLYFNDDLTEL